MEHADPGRINGDLSNRRFSVLSSPYPDDIFEL
jgi:hypothetical protein